MGKEKKVAVATKFRLAVLTPYRVIKAIFEDSKKADARARSLSKKAKKRYEVVRIGASKKVGDKA